MCRTLRAGGDVGILMLTARIELKDRVLGLESGADDYLVKPFAFKELVARLRAILRRKGINMQQVLRAGDVALDRQSRRVSRGGTIVELTQREFDMMELFLSHPRQVFTRDVILNRVWGYDYLGDTNVIDVHIRHLREKLSDESRTLIRSVRGVGYSLEPPDGLALPTRTFSNPQNGNRCSGNSNLALKNKLRSIGWNLPVGVQLSVIYAVLLAGVLTLLGFALYSQLDKFMVQNTADRLNRFTQPVLARPFFGRDQEGPYSFPSTPPQDTTAPELQATSILHRAGCRDYGAHPQQFQLSRGRALLHGQHYYFYPGHDYFHRGLLARIAR